MLKDEMTEQGVFDHVAKHLLHQNCKSEGKYKHSEHGELTDCLYRNPDGLMCAAGCLISNDEYTPEMEGKPICGKATSSIFPKRILENADLVSRLQKIHDTHPVYVWKESLSDLAAIRKLNDFP